jgi:hypothetical protein
MNAKGSAVGVVWRQGEPVIDTNWLEHLRPDQREWVDKHLQSRGFRLNGNKVEHANTGNDSP